MGDSRERRLCFRFEIPGATLHYWNAGFDPYGKNDGEKNLPVLDMSRGGIRFLSQEEISLQSLVQVEVDFPEENQSLSLKGQVIWSVLDPADEYKYQNGIVFDREWMDQDKDAQTSLKFMENLEQKYCSLE
ncbi:PilZ domain-containing protein [Acidobacteriota bacterium]